MDELLSPLTYEQLTETMAVLVADHRANGELFELKIVEAIDAELRKRLRLRLQKVFERSAYGPDDALAVAVNETWKFAERLSLNN
jgi:hypothetical protein